MAHTLTRASSYTPLCAASRIPLKAATSRHHFSNTRTDTQQPTFLPTFHPPTCRSSLSPFFFLGTRVPPHTHTHTPTPSTTMPSQTMTRNYQPPSAHHIDSTRDDDDHDAGAPSGPVDLVHDDYAAVETTSAPSTGIRKSPASSSSPSEQHQDTTSPTSSSSETSHTHHDPRRGVADFTTPAIGTASNLPAWAIAALQETLDQPWKAHFNEDDAANAERDMSMRNDPDFARGRDTVPFYDGRLKVCYGEGSISA